MTAEALDERSMIEEMRTSLTLLEKNLNNLTPRHFSKKEVKELRRQISVWRFYLSHTHFDKDLEHLNTPATKPPMQFLYNLLTTGRSLNELVSLCAAPNVRESLDLRYGADYLKMVMSRILHYSEPIPVPKSFYLPFDHPNKTDQEGIPFSKSKSKAAVKWRKKKAAEKREQEALKPRPKPTLSEDESEKRRLAYLKEKNRQREAYRKAEKLAREEAIQRHETAEKERERTRRLRSGG